MKKLFLCSVVITILLGTKLFSQSIIQGGNMEDASKWALISFSPGTHTETFNYTVSKPTGAEGGCLRVTGAAGAALVNTGICQQITLKKHITYKADLLFKDQSANLTNLWFQVYLNKNKPVNGVDINTGMLTEFSTWGANCAKGVDGLMSVKSCNGSALNFSVGTTEGDTTIWFILKWGTTSTNPYDLLVDTVSISYLPFTVKASKTFIAVDQTEQMSIDYSPLNAYEKVVTWSVENGTGEATIDSDGLLTCTKAGSVTVKAISNANAEVSGQKVIDILDQLVLVSSVSVTGTGGATAITNDKGTLQMVAGVLPVDAMEKAVKWKIISGNSFAAIDSISGLVTAKKNGTITIRATSIDGSNVFGETTIAISNQIRDAFKNPFGAFSIWNMPIHNNATYVPAKLTCRKDTTSLDVDEDIIILKPNAPIMNVETNTADWSGNDRCPDQGPTLFSAPIPANYIYNSSVWQGTTPNAGASILMTNGVNIKQTQPFAKCGTTFATSHYEWDENQCMLKGECIRGAHGGSGLSSIGGTIRYGEFTSGEINHVIKMNLWGKLFVSHDNGGHRWPGAAADGGYNDPYSFNYYNGTVPELVMGSLLALNKIADINAMGFETTPGKILAKTLQDYGAYVVDNTGWDNFAIMTETGPDGIVRNEFYSLYGFNIQKWNGLDDSPWGRDLKRIITNLYVVNSNDADNIGGGPTTSTDRRAPLALPFGTRAPSCSISSPQNNASFIPLSNISISADVVDDDGAIKLVDFYKDGVKIGTSVTSPFSFVWKNVPEGSYKISAKSTNYVNAEVTSSEINVIVKPTGVDYVVLNDALISVFPNPVDNGQSITLKLEVIKKLCNVKIYNMSGKLVYSGTTDKMETSISTQGLPSGLYLINVTEGVNNYYKKFIIK